MSLVLGIMWFGGLGSLLAVIFGRIAKAQIRESGEGGDGMATAGIALGVVGLVALLFLVIALALLAKRAVDNFHGISTCPDYGIGC